MTPWEEFHYDCQFSWAWVRLRREVYLLQIQQIIKWRPRGFVLKGRLGEMFQGQGHRVRR